MRGKRTIRIKSTGLGSEAKSEYVSFGDVARDRCGEQCQYVSNYVNPWREGTPDLGAELRFQGDPGDYHSLRIHRDDVEEFVRRYLAHRAAVNKHP